MQSSHPQEADSPGGRPCQSLTFALQTVIHDAGGHADFDDLSAALGHCWMVSAATDEKDVANWPLYARDAFLISAGRLFGLGIRGIHPPEAARGIRDLPEFRQHFDASYRPLVLRALEHDQPVLAWQGWGGDRGMLWGIITDTCGEGVGLCGRMPWPGETPPRPIERPADIPVPSVAACHARVSLDKPPVQLYVVETTAPVQPDPDELLRFAFDRAALIVTSGLRDVVPLLPASCPSPDGPQEPVSESLWQTHWWDRFGVLTGPAAYDLWLERLRADSKETGTPPASFEGHRRMAASTIAAHRSGVRFLERPRATTTGETRTVIDAMVAASGRIVAALSDGIVAALSEGVDAAVRDHSAMAKALSHARQATAEMSDALEAQP